MMTPSTLPWILRPVVPSLVGLMFALGITSVVGYYLVNQQTNQQKQAALNHQLQELPVLLYTQPDVALSTAQAARETALSLGISSALGQSYYWLAEIERANAQAGQYYAKPALKLAEISLSIFQSLDDPYWQSKARLLISELLILQLDEGLPERPRQALRESIQSHWTAVESFLSQSEGGRQQPRIQGDLAKNKGYFLFRTHYAHPDSLEQAKAWYQKALIAYEQARDVKGAAVAYRFLGRIYGLLGSLSDHQSSSSAQDSLFLRGEQALKTAARNFLVLQDSLGYSQVLNRQGNLYRDWYEAQGIEKYRNKALLAHHQALSLSPHNLAEPLYHTAYLYHLAAAFAGDEPEADAFIDSASHYYQTAANQAIEEVNPTLLERILENWRPIAEAKGAIDQVFAIEKDLLIPLTMKSAAVEAEATELVKDYELEILNQQSTLTRTYLLLGGISLFVCLLFAFFLLYYRVRTRHYRQEIDKEIRLIQTQMNPHFIGNTLNNIDSLINQSRNAEASRYLVQFSRLASLILAHSNKQEIPLRQEIDTLKYYLELERLRLNERFSYDLEVDSHIEVHSILIPPMLLQPFVENAVWHGLQHKIYAYKESGGHLLVAFRQDTDTRLTCIVEDNGIGRAKAGELQGNGPQSTKRSHSTDLIANRLRMMGHQEQASIQTIDLHDDQTGAPSGTRVIIQIPIKRRETTEK